MASTAGAGPAAVCINAGYQVIHGRLHQRLPLVDFNAVFCAVVFYKSDMPHKRLRQVVLNRTTHEDGYHNAGMVVTR